ncbi:MAG: OmpH family outer membrane protein [Parachlamydiales bacterium]|nr:OmpH family outer membrane protein [Parachlamydiales bacterium]
MRLKTLIVTLILLLSFKAPGFCIEKSIIGVVNFMNCVTDSKYGKNEQEQLENIKKQWSSVIEETEKELKDLNSKFQDQDYMDSLSPEAEEELKFKQKSLSEDMMKQQNQLYQILNQANYFFIQKISNNISKASEKIAADKKLDLVLNKEACFYNNPKIDVTDLVIKEMDRNFDKETAKNETKEANETAINQETKQISELQETKKAG